MMSADVEESREKKKIDIELNEITAGKHYHGKYQEMANARIKEQRDQHQRSKIEKLERLQRRNRYAELVAEMFPPSQPKERRKQDMEPVDELEHPVKPHRERLYNVNNSHPPAANRRRRRASNDDSVNANRRDEYASNDQQYSQRGAKSNPSSSPRSPLHKPGPLYDQPQLSSRRDDPMSVGVAPAARLSEWQGKSAAPVSLEMDVHSTQNTIKSSVFADISPPPVRLSVGGMSNEHQRTSHYSNTDMAVGQVTELGVLESDLQKQSEESSAVMAAIKSRLDALENTPALT